MQASILTLINRIYSTFSACHYFLERRRQLFWSVNDCPNLILHGIADAERILQFYGYSSTESAHLKGEDLVTRTKEVYFIKQ